MKNKPIRKRASVVSKKTVKTREAVKPQTLKYTKKIEKITTPVYGVPKPTPVPVIKAKKAINKIKNNN